MLNSLNKPVLQSLLSQEITIIANASAPAVPTYYIPRYLTRKTRLKPEVFAITCPDVFVFENLSLREIFDLAKGKPVDRSISQIRKLTAKFIALEFPEDLQRISATAKHTPVHLIRKVNEKYFWIKSYGCIQIIQEYIHAEPCVLSEDSFISNVSNQRFVCISDDPGMGKSLLLANICRMTSRTQNKDKNNPHIYLEFSTLLEKCVEYETYCASSSVLNVIADCVSTNDFGKGIILEILKSEKYSAKLFLDGFDEVPHERLHLAIKFLSSFAKKRNSHQVFCSTRRHRQEELEEALCELSYNILPFTYSNQVEFICSFWSHEYKIEKSETLTEFATNVIQSVQERLESNGEEIIGIPLQCAILGEIYSADGIKHSFRKPSNLGVYVEIFSICDMYQMLEKKRLQHLGTSEKIQVKMAHALRAIMLLFPDVSIPEYLCGKYLEKLDNNRVNKLGFMQICLNSPSKSIAGFRFVHRTFAEYFLACLVVDVIFGRVDFPEVFTSSLIKKCLQNSEDKREIKINTHSK